MSNASGRKAIAQLVPQGGADSGEERRRGDEEFVGPELVGGGW